MAKLSDLISKINADQIVEEIRFLAAARADLELTPEPRDVQAIEALAAEINELSIKADTLKRGAK